MGHGNTRIVLVNGKRSKRKCQGSEYTELVVFCIQNLIYSVKPTRQLGSMVESKEITFFWIFRNVLRRTSKNLSGNFLLWARNDGKRDVHSLWLVNMRK